MTINTPHKISQTTSKNTNLSIYTHKNVSRNPESSESATVSFVRGELGIEDVAVVSIKLASVCHSAL